MDKQALHDIRVTFQASRIWTLFRNFQQYHMNEYNLDILLPSLKLEYLNIDVKITIHHTDTVSVAIGCSSGPLSIEEKDIFQFIEVLTRIENHITRLIDFCLNVINTRNNARINSEPSRIATTYVPRFNTWIVKMWHFGIDTLDEYTSKEFHVTLEEGIGDLYRLKRV